MDKGLFRLILLLAPLIALAVVFGIAQPIIWRWVFDDSPSRDAVLLGDVLIIVIALLALGVSGFGLLAYRLLERALSDKLDLRTQHLLFKTFANIGFVCWGLYKPKEPYKTGEPIAPEIEAAVDMAVWSAEESLAQAAKLDEHAQCTGQNNLAYHLATRGKLADEERARQMASHILERAPSYGNNWQWRETYVWVVWRYARDDVDSRTAKKVLCDLLADPTVPSMDRRHWEQKYRELLKL